MSMTTITDEALDHYRMILADNEQLRKALEIKHLVTASNRNTSSERLDRVERICDEAIASCRSAHHD